MTSVRRSNSLGLPPDVRTRPQQDFPGQQEIRVRFLNCSGSVVDLLWIDQTGRGIKYAQLRPVQFLDIRTYQGHPWIFRHADSGAPYPCNHVIRTLESCTAGPIAEVYWPVYTAANPAVITRADVVIVKPELSLADICVANIARGIKVDRESIDSLPLPRNLQDKLEEGRMASFKQMRKLVPERERLSHQQVRDIVRQAIQSDDAGKEELFGRLKGKGIDKEIAGCLLELVGEEAELLIEAGDLAHIRDYIALLGVDSSVTTFRELVKLFGSEKSGVQRNCCLLLDFFMSTVSIFSHAHLRETVKKEAPELVANLWQRSQTGSATCVARQLVYVLLLERDYLDVAEATDVWTGMLSSAMKKSPVMALLTVLMTGEVTRPLSTVSFDLEQAQEEPVTSAWAQFVDLVTCHSDHLLLCLPVPSASHCLAQVFKYHSVRGGQQGLEEVLRQLLGNRELMSRQDRTSDVVREAAKLLLEEGIELDKATSKILSKLSKGQFGPSDGDDSKQIDVKEALKELGYSEELLASPETLKWSHLIELQTNGTSSLVAAVLERIKAADATKLLSKTPKMLSKADIASVISICQQLASHLPCAALPSPSLLPDILAALSSCEQPLPAAQALSLCADVVKLAARRPEERDTVTLALSIASTFNETRFEAADMFAMEALLYSCLRYAHPTICNDQVAVYSHLVTKHFRGCQFFVQFKKAAKEELERLSYGCTRIAIQICQQQDYFSRVVCSILSETVMGYQHIEAAMCKLHSISDKHSSALLATTMPVAEKRQYSRVFPEIKKSLKHVV